MKIKVGLVDDHLLFMKSLSMLLEALKDYEVVLEADNGKDLQQQLETKKVIPDIMLIDVNMPGMNGFEIATWLQQHFPAIKLIALSMNEKDSAIIKMFKAGCCAYLLKDVHPSVLERALHEVYSKGYYNIDAAQFNPRRLLQTAKNAIVLTPKEQQFLKLACTEMTYKQIAFEMHVAERTVDGYREALFQKFCVQSRIGLCLEAIRKEFVDL